MQASYDFVLGTVILADPPKSAARQPAARPAAPIMPSAQAARRSVQEPAQTRTQTAISSMAHLQPGSPHAAQAARFQAVQQSAPLPERLMQEAAASPHLAAPCASGLRDVTRPQAESARCRQGNFSNVSVVHDSGSEDCKSSSKSASSNGPFLQSAGAGSVHAAAGQHASNATARSGKASKSRLKEETWPTGKETGKAITSGQKRQALGELRPQQAKHSQREQQAWTQCTDDSDDFA